MSLAQHQIHYVSNRDGWRLELKQCRLPTKVNKKRRPLMIIPGYGMNAFIFGFHPRGLSLEEYLTQKGFEVWSVNFRNQGGSIRENGSRRYGMKELALTDLGSAAEFIVSTAKSETGKVDLIGCSLGGTLAYIYTALGPRRRTGSIVAIGAPLRWEEVHPFMRLVTLSPSLAGIVPFVSTKGLLKTFSPVISRLSLLKLYLHPEMVDLRHAKILLETVENPNRFLNRELSEWVHTKDLHLNGKNLTREFRRVKNPLLCVLANADGIVPPLTALSAHEVASSRVKETLVIGTDKLRFAHADLFVSNHCHEMVFRPISEWLLRQYPA